jgi:hypothetical protein
MFFFEKKNQKTFTSCASVKQAGSPEEQKFFASFFQKRRPSFLPFLRHAAVHGDQ